MTATLDQAQLHEFVCRFLTDLATTPRWSSSAIASACTLLWPKPARRPPGRSLGCGHGASSILLAQAYPASIVVGYDNHAPSIDAARRAAREAGVDDRVRFELASAQVFPGGDYGLVCTFDALHDMGDPVGAAMHIREALASDGTWLLVEPAAGESVADNLSPVGRLFYSASTFICTPAARSQPGGYALGAQASEAQLRHVTEQGRVHSIPPCRRHTGQPDHRNPSLTAATRARPGEHGRVAVEVDGPRRRSLTS